MKQLYLVLRQCGIYGFDHTDSVCCCIHGEQYEVESIRNDGSSSFFKNISNSTSTNTSNNTFNITAEFPNANDVDEIREAIMSLPNLASQYLARK